jgi:hypothetical protein
MTTRTSGADQRIRTESADTNPTTATKARRFRAAVTRSFS